MRNRHSLRLLSFWAYLARKEVSHMANKNFKESGMYIVRDEKTREITGIDFVSDLKTEEGGQYHEFHSKEDLGEYFNILLDEIKEEHALEERERYHTGIYLDAGEYEGEWFADNNTPNMFINLVEAEEAAEAFISSLEEHEQRRLRLKLDDPSLPYTKIASVEGVNESSIRRCFKRIEEKYKNFFPTLMPN